MTQEELAILEEEKQNKSITINYKNKYSDEFYDAYINSFVPNSKKRLLYRAIKRFADIVISFISLCILIVPFIIIGIIIKCDSKGPAIFKNRRVGKNGKIFNCLKFRSMSTKAPAEKATSLGGTDEYITKVGRFLRKTSIDELPQLFNVLVGQMSFIGYRPLVPTEENCNNMREKLGVFKMRPGISGYTQVHGRDDVYYKNKAIMDAYYVKHANLWMDISLILKSIKVVLKREGNEDEVKNVTKTKEARDELNKE